MSGIDTKSKNQEQPCITAVPYNSIYSMLGVLVVNCRGLVKS
jgi:hypothetical protein